MINSVALDSKANRRYETSVEPYIEPITVAELKLFARIDDSTEDSLLENFIKTARKLSEKYTNRAFIQQTISLYMDYWPGRVIVLPRPPLISVSAVEYFYEDGTTETYSSDNYYILTSGLRGELIIKKDCDLPINTDNNYGGYRIIYKAGYGQVREDVPEGIKDGIKIWATELYDGRATSTAPPPQARKLLKGYRVRNR